MNKSFKKNSLHHKGEFLKESNETRKDIFNKLDLELNKFPDESFTNIKTDIVITPKAYLGICVHAIKYADPRKQSKNWSEVIGLLLGKLIERSSIFPQVIIQDCYPIGHGSASYVEINEYAFLPELMSKNMVIVGWYHSHPSFGLFMSNEDYNTQLRYQKQWKHSVGLVVDPTLISSLNFGIDVFRLDSDDLKHFELTTYSLSGNFKPRSINNLLGMV